MTKEQLKTETSHLIDELTDDVSWEDLMYSIYVRQKIEKGIADCENGRTYTTDEVKAELGLNK